MRGAALLLAGVLAGCSAPEAPASNEAAVNVAAPAIVNDAAPGNDAFTATEAEVKAKGAKAWLAGASDGKGQWQALLDGMAAGEPHALALATELRPAADAGKAEALDISAAQGLPKAPLQVLSLTAAGAPLTSLCTSPFIEPEAGVEASYNKAALAALDAIPAGQRPASYGACRAELEKIAKELEVAKG